MAQNLDFTFASKAEICTELGRRLRDERLGRNRSQAEVAKRAGISRATLVRLEGDGTCTLDTLVGVCQALGLLDHLQNLFKSQTVSIAEMEARAAAPKRARSSRAKED